MSYIGNQPADIGVYAVQSETGNGVLTAFTLDRAATTATILVSIDGVDQIPPTAYAVSGTTLTFTSAPPNTSVISTRLLGDTVSFGEPSDNSVTSAKMATGVSLTDITSQNTFFKNWNTVTSTQTTTIASSENAAIIGPITVNSGVTWTIVGTLTFL